jgi:hypothetical protein
VQSRLESMESAEQDYLWLQTVGHSRSWKRNSLRHGGQILVKLQPQQRKSLAESAGQRQWVWRCAQPQSTVFVEVLDPKLWYGLFQGSWACLHYTRRFVGLLGQGWQDGPSGAVQRGWKAASGTNHSTLQSPGWQCRRCSLSLQEHWSMIPGVQTPRRADPIGQGKQTQAADLGEI